MGIDWEEILNAEDEDIEEHLFNMCILQDAIKRFDKIDPDGTLIRKITNGTMKLSEYSFNELSILVNHLYFRKDLRRLGVKEAELSNILPHELEKLFMDISDRRENNNWPDVKTPDIDAALEIIKPFYNAAKSEWLLHPIL